MNHSPKCNPPSPNFRWCHICESWQLKSGYMEHERNCYKSWQKHQTDKWIYLVFAIFGLFVGLPIVLRAMGWI